MENTLSASPWRQSLEAAKANILPGLALQGVAISLLAAYYWYDPARAAFDQIASLKTRWGWWYSLMSTSLFGGVIPFLYLRTNKRTRSLTPYSHGVFYVAFWAYKGLEVDALYRLQDHLFGKGHDALTLLYKVLCDQFVYNPLWSAPIALFFFHWKEEGFRFAVLRRTSWPRYFRKALPAGLISTWSVWIPTVAVIYCLPSSLQVPLFNVVLCFWVLFLTTLTRRGKS